MGNREYVWQSAFAGMGLITIAAKALLRWDGMARGMEPVCGCLLQRHVIRSCAPHRIILNNLAGWDR